MFGSLITRPLRFATRVTWWGAQQALGIAGGVLGRVAHRGEDHEAGSGHGGGGGGAGRAGGGGGGSEPAAWRGPGASSTSAPGDSGSTRVAGPGRTPARRSSRPAPVNGAGEVQTGGRSGGRAGTRERPSEPRPVTRRARVAESDAERRPTRDAESDAERRPARDAESDAERALEIRAAEQPAPAPPPPVVPEPGHVSEEPTLVEEVADAGAEEGAGAQIRIGEPWEGYRQMKAADIIGRLASSSREELAAVELYETVGRKRKSVLAAAQRALKQASPPR